MPAHHVGPELFPGVEVKSAGGGGPLSIQGYSTAFMGRKFPTFNQALRKGGWDLAPEVHGITAAWGDLAREAVRLQTKQSFLNWAKKQ